MNKPENCLRLARSENVGKSTFFRLIDIFGSAEEALSRISDGSMTPAINRKIKVCSTFEAEKEIENCQKFGAEIITFFDSRYSKLLREIADPAPILTAKGDLDFMNRETIAIVGPRNASFGATNLARKIATELGQKSIIVASGLARGVDSSAHEGSILSGTIAVIGGGIDHIYPRENEKLFREVASRGLLISENPFGAAPKGGNFIQRNRIISGLSLAVVVVEAGLKSGSLTTARFAVEQGREVFAVPGSPFDPRCQGANRLIKNGAKMFESIEDIFEELPRLRRQFCEVGMLHEPKQEEFAAPAPKIPQESEIQKIRNEILSRLSFVPIEIEEIIGHMKLPAKLVNIAVVQLELMGKVEVNFGKVNLISQ